ncbi:hypothetical protein VTO42DRAFT_6208 [Malbranchea cinnamomea]|uniref:AA9 family lytic polysaccharide monooxygenase A n=1 Tax=Malbranchea cinnamomea TaxID=5041 RepID=LP9A_MALCI|nr:LPMO9A [Malbranchea cinnamomea]
MSPSFKSTAILGAVALAARVRAHGYVSGIVVDGAYHGGYIVDKYPYMPNPPDVVGWSTTATDLGFVAPDAFGDPDIICHRDGAPGAIHAKVNAGATIELQWNTWPESHHGPVIDYLANCNGDCSSVDKTSLKFFKISEAGLNDGSNAPGQWASDDLIANNNSWTVTIPKSIAPGNYVLRHEIIALHSAGNQNGAQNYPQCFNLEITSNGSDNPEGVLGTELYKADDPGILFNIYQPMDSYPIPGPALYTGGSSPSPNPPTSTQSPVPQPTQSPPSGSNPGNGNGDDDNDNGNETPSPSLPVEIPDDLTSRELLLVAQEIIARLLELQNQLVVSN